MWATGKLTELLPLATGAERPILDLRCHGFGAMVLVWCNHCEKSWVYLDRVHKQPYCNFCLRPWPLKELLSGTQGNYMQDMPAPGDTWNEWYGFPKQNRRRKPRSKYEKPTPPPGLDGGKSSQGGAQRTVEAKADYEEALKELWAQADPVQRELLNKIGVCEPKPEQKSLTDLCNQYEDELPQPKKDALQPAVPKPTAEQALPSVHKEYKEATVGMRKLIWRKAQLQCSINEAKEKYAALLEEMASLQKEEAVAQQKVCDLQVRLQQQVPNLASDDALQEAKLGAALTTAGLVAPRQSRTTTSKKSTCLPRQVLRCRGVPAVLSCCVCELLIWGRQLCKFTSFALTQQLTVDANGGVNQKWYGPHFGGSHWRFASLKGCSAWQAVHPSFSCPRPRYEITTLPTCVRSANSEGGWQPPDY